MAMLLLDGCDIYSDRNALMRRWDTSDGLNQLTISPTAGRFGGGALAFAADECWIGKYIPPRDEVYVGFSAQRRNDNTNPPLTGEADICTYKSSSNTHCYWSYFETGGVLRLRDYAGNILAETSQTLDPTYRFIEFGVKISSDPGIGWAQARLNGDPTPIINYVGPTRNPSAYSDNIVEIRIEGGIYRNEGGQFRHTRFNIDDIYICDAVGDFPTSFIGDCKVVTDAPIGDVTQVGYTSTNSTFYTEVDDGAAADDDTTYIQATAVGHEAIFDFPDLPETPDAIYGVAVTHLSRKTDAGSGWIAGKAVDGGDEVVGPGVSIASSYGYDQSFMPNAPDGSQWTKSNLDSADYGIEVVTAS